MASESAVPVELPDPARTEPGEPESGAPDLGEPELGNPAVARSWAKRVFDRVGAAMLLAASSPLLLVIALAIRLDTRGPVLFRQRRVGLRGRPFTVLKFRSMHAGCDEEPHRKYVEGLVTGATEATNGNGAFKLTQDDRITRVGVWLRRTSMDELPQLWNVLRGDMSLVGPRPPLPYEVEHYDETQRQRLTCRPGLTGLWQVSGRNHLSYRTMVDLDLEYIRSWSFWLDLKILIMTFPVVLKNTGNAH